MRIDINIDCADRDRMVDFYTEALGYVAHGSAGETYRSIMPAEGEGPKIIFQQVPESKVVKNRVHLDLIVGEGIEAQARRFEELGATRVSTEPVVEYGCSWIVMQDPEGNELCLCSD
jgi:predicted enzyme related to lactoylglutathione lyase